MPAFRKGRWLAVFGLVLGSGGCAPKPASSSADAVPRPSSTPSMLEGSMPEPTALPTLARSYVGMPLPEAPALPRGIGRMSARLPGTDYDLEGVRLVRHTARVTIQDGFARTEVEEEFHNDTGRVLEGRFEFALPSRASVSRMALKVGSNWVEAEMVERRRAREIFDQIVDDLVRPRDPALLEKNAGRLSLRVFPIPARASRWVSFSYDEPLERSEKGLRYAYRLSAAAREIERFSIDVSLRHAPERVESSWPDASIVRESNRVRVRSKKTHFVPDRDFVIEYAKQDGAALPLSTYRSKGETYFSVRVPIPSGSAAPKVARRAIVIDKSARQTDASLSEERALVLALLRATPRARFVVLACDSACVAYPKRGLLETSGASIEQVREWLEGLEPSGASDVAGALELAGRKLEGASSAQLVYVGDVSPSAGELDPAAIGERVRAAVHEFDLRLVGVAASALDNLAALSGGASHSLSGSDALDDRIARVVAELRTPVIASPRLEMDAEGGDVFPRVIANQMQGGELLVVGRFRKSRPKTVTLVGTVDGESVRTSYSLEGRYAENRLLPRLWAEARIAELERAGDEASKREIREISLASHVLSRETSLIALENDAMFREYGIARGHGSGKLVMRAHRTKAPQIRMATTSVSGRMPPESIQRVVRQNLGRFRACYHRGLLKRPSLEGRVVLRFLIDRLGQVAAAESGESTLPDPNVVNCMVEEARNLRFPAPEQVVRIEYPLMLSPSEASEPIKPERGPALRQFSLPSDGRSADLKSEAGNDDWIDDSAWSAAKVVEEVAREGRSRRWLEWLIRDRLANGRFESAHFAAKLFVERDPDNGRAYDLLAETSAVNDDRERLLAAAAMRAVIEPRSLLAQENAAQAFAWAGEGTRACAHFRAAASLPGASQAARRGLEACETRGPRDLIPEPASALSVDLECAAGARCPALVVISSSGAVSTESANGRRGLVRISALDEEAYRIVAIGGASAVRARIRVTLLGESTTYPVSPDGPRTIAIVRR